MSKKLKLLVKLPESKHIFLILNIVKKIKQLNNLCIILGH